MKFNNNQLQAIENLTSIDSKPDIFWDTQTGCAKFVKGKLTKPSSDKTENIARRFLEKNSGLLDLEEKIKETLVISGIEIDNQGFSHVFFSQSLNNIPVFEGSTQVHINPDGVVVAYKDYRLATIDVSISPRLSEHNAINILLQDCALSINAIRKTTSRLVLFRDAEKHQHLAWEVEWFADKELAASIHIIDAHTGNILLKHTRIRSMASRLTYSANNTSNLKKNLLLRDDETSTDKVAQAAHDNAKKVYDYFKSKFGRDSYDGRGADLVSTVHYKQNYNNAFWIDGRNQMVYGDGDGQRFAPLSLALDVVAHELAHAVSSRTARFVYAEEAGALDESFSDFFAVVVAEEGEITNWQIGEDVYTPFRSGDALRNMAEPGKQGQPDHMNDFMALSPGEQPDANKNDNGYLHSNSGIPNKAAYLLIAGGLFHGINVEGIGRDKAEQIYYLALTAYMASSTYSRWTFMQTRYALLNACRQLYGDTGNEYAQLKNAWAAIGVGEPAETFGIIRKDSSPNIAIPDNNADGITDTIYIDDEGMLKDITVGIAIEHTYIGDLLISLISPSGKSVILHNRDGGSSQDLVETYNFESTPGLNAFAGDPVKGEWVLSVSDNANVDTGKLLMWELDISLKKEQKKELTTQVSPAKTIPDNDQNGIESAIQISQSGKIIRLDISVDISHTWIGDLTVILTSPAGNEIVLHNRSGRSRNDIKRIYSTSTDNLLLALLNTDIQGSWLLNVVDNASKDTGSLNAWGIDCVYE